MLKQDSHSLLAHSFILTKGQNQIISIPQFYAAETFECSRVEPCLISGRDGLRPRQRWLLMKPISCDASSPQTKQGDLESVSLLKIAKIWEVIYNRQPDCKHLLKQGFHVKLV